VSNVLASYSNLRSFGVLVLLVLQQDMCLIYNKKFEL